MGAFTVGASRCCLRSAIPLTHGWAYLLIHRSWMRRMGTGFRKCSLRRPARRAVTRFAASSTRRCFMTPKRVIPGRAASNSSSAWPSRSKSRSRRIRRLTSANALKAASSSMSRTICDRSVTCQDSNALDLFGLHPLDWSLAGGAIPACLDRRAAHGMAQRLGIARDSRAPVGEQTQRSGELLALGGQLVDESDWPLAIRLCPDDALRLEALQAIREDVRRDAGDAGLELVEAPGSFQQRLDQEQAPSVPHPLEGSRERRFGCWHGRSVRHRSSGSGIT